MRKMILYARRAVEPGYAKRWIRINWWRVLYTAFWAALGIVIREAVAATRPESWVVGSEIFPAALCWMLALRVAVGERSAKSRR